MKTGRPNLESGAAKRLRGQDALRLSPVGFHYQLAALGPSREVEASTSTSRLVRPLIPPPQRNQFHLYALVSKFQRLSQNKTARFSRRVRTVLTECRGRVSSRCRMLTHIYAAVKFSLLAAKNQIQALTTTVNLVRGVASAMWAPQGHPKH